MLFKSALQSMLHEWFLTPLRRFNSLRFFFVRFVSNKFCRPRISPLRIWISSKISGFLHLNRWHACFMHARALSLSLLLLCFVPMNSCSNIDLKSHWTAATTNIFFLPLLPTGQTHWSLQLATQQISSIIFFMETGMYLFLRIRIHMFTTALYF